MINTMKNRDCLGELGMPMIADGSVDMVLCDLPYGQTWNKWDSVIDFVELWKHYERIVKPTGVIVLTASQPFTSLVVCSNPKMYKCSWIWVKDNTTGFVNAHYQPMKKTEDILVFSKAGMAPSAKTKVTYNAQGIIPYNKVTRRGSAGKNYCDTLKSENFQEYTNYPDNLLHFAYDKDKVHPTQKPVALMEYLIRTYTNHGDTVMDNCAGSGTTLVAAVNTGRNYIGFELDKGYYDIAVRRIEDAKANIEQSAV